MRKICLLGVAIMSIWNAPLHGQSGAAMDPAGLQLTRTQLEEMLSRFEQTASESANSDAVRREARAEADMVRQRLQDGDLRAGDRVVLLVEGFAELSDTFNVGANRSIVLPEIGGVALTGVLRSELQPHLADYVSRFINNPVVHAHSLVRLEILGAVARPGFYAVPSEVLVTDALMIAGGPLPTAELEGITIERGADVIWSGERLREAVIEGRTLDQLSIRAGDGIHVPEASNRLQSAQNIVFVVAGLASLVTLLIQIF